jgi:hypothetical protein
MNNRAFYQLLHDPKTERGRRRWTVAKVAEAIYCSRAYVQDVLNNRTEHGRLVRRKLVKFFQKEFPLTWRMLLEALGWDEQGRVKPAEKSNI